MHPYLEFFREACAPNLSTGDLQLIYSVVPLAFVGGSLFPGSRGHNVTEPAAASCAVITGPCVGVNAYARVCVCMRCERMYVHMCA